MADTSTAEQGERLARQLRQAGIETVGEAAALGAWTSSEWLVLRTLTGVEAATAG